MLSKTAEVTEPQLGSHTARQPPGTPPLPQGSPNTDSGLGALDSALAVISDTGLGVAEDGTGCPPAVPPPHHSDER